ncbi:Peroxisomal NADH pyrophosphatase NUDT12 [Paramyrothecium foliicola]|nr:Peroxisomal NADH pyrophosphatase NUDT12 [Paramyrothecium foliicola]
MSGLTPLNADQAALENDDSLLSQRFGKEVVNYYSGSRLNRYSFLRADTAFLQATASSPAAVYLGLHSLNPLVTSASELAYFGFDDVKPILGDELFHLSEEDCIEQFDSTVVHPQVVFLGMLESAHSHQFTTSAHGTVTGQPFFAIDLTPKGPQTEALTSFLQKQEIKKVTAQLNPRGLTLQNEAAAMFAQARSMIDWNLRNGFCAGCGNPTLSVHAGYKRVCPPTDRKGGPGAVPRDDCPTRHGVSNLCFPRSDPTMIAAVVSADGTRILLGRQKRWPAYWYSTLAGFIEPGESIEESVRREVWEESGVRVGRVVIHSSQPWPYPASLMIGAVAQAIPGPGETINLNDKELEDAKWFTMEEVREALRTGASALGGPAPENYKEGALRLPPGQAIANQLIAAVAQGYLTGMPKI